MSSAIEDSKYQQDMMLVDHETQTLFLPDSEDDVKKKSTDLESKLLEFKRKHEKLTQKVKQLKTQLRTEKEKWLRVGRDWKNKYEDLERTIKDDNTEYSYKESSPDDSVQYEWAGDKEKSYIHEKEVLALKERITILEQNLQKAQNERDALQAQNKSSKRQTKGFPKSFEDSQEKVGLPERRAKSQNSKTVSIGKKKKTNIRMERDSLKEDNEKLRMRLSEIAGSLVVDRNPSIADLSDEYRPSKLADSFSELYDNEWTDAFEEQEGNEKEAIQNLLTMLVKIHKKCQILGSKYLLALEESSITLPGKGRKILEQTGQIPPIIRKLLLGIRKNFTPLIIQILTKLFQGKFIGKTEESFKDRKATSQYIEKCTHLCWYMAIKDPPVVLGPIPNEEDIVNKDLFSFFTNSGQHVHFCVWPPLLLHKGGSLLRKGVIQGK